MSKLKGEILTLQKMSGYVSTTKSLIGNMGAKTINIGEKGDDGATFIPSVSADGVISWTNDKELPNPEPVNIKGGKGDKGDPGENGKDGADGHPGENGTDGYSPTANVTQNDNGATITITDKNGTTTATIINGKDGADGTPGKDGDQGQQGDAGGYYAPAVTQPDTNTMRFSFTPSKADMPAVSDTEITIPSGGSGSVAVDSTLTVSGQAADAKVTGDALRSLSDEIADCIKSPASAEVGQTIVVKAIGDDGKPTEWEPVTLPKQVQADWKQNDSTAADYVKNRTHYEESVQADYVLNMTPTEIVGFSMPEVGETITVKINGVESAETVKEAESIMVGISYKYIGNIDADSLFNGGTGWIIMYTGATIGLANPDTTITIENIVVHKINNKFINFDGLVRTFDYYFGDSGPLYKTLYNNAGNECLLYMRNHFILPETGSQLFGFMGEIGLSKVESVSANSCFVTGVIIDTIDGSITVKNVILGTNNTEMNQLAEEYGYTLTTKPNV